jgi:predicted metal-dependent HD superfamily phosphohydrolase
LESAAGRSVVGEAAVHWQSLCARAGMGTESLFQTIATRYQEPHRHYHNLEHITDCLETFEPVRGLAQHEIAVEWAIWFHDVLYDTHSPDNEARSAAEATSLLSAVGAAKDLAATVAELILATRHIAPPRSHDEALLMDIDLSILGAASDRFDRYETAVRREYDWVPDEVFWTKRAAILGDFLARPRIFHSDWFGERLERIARENLERSAARAKPFNR